MKKSQLRLNDPLEVRPLQTAVEQVDELLRGIESRHSQLDSDRTATAAELAELEAAAGEKYLDGQDAGASRIIELRVRLELIAGAIAALDKRRGVLLQDRRRAEMNDARSMAAEKRAELAKLRAAAEPHLKALSAIENVEYNPCILAAQRTGLYTVNRTADKPGDHHAPNEVGPELFGPNAGRYLTPRSRLIADEIERLESLANTIEQEISPGPPPKSFIPPAAKDGPHWTTPESPAPIRRRADETPAERAERSLAEGWVPVR